MCVSLCVSACVCHVFVCVSRRSVRCRWLSDAATQVYDAARLTSELHDDSYWDARHFYPHVYNRLNAALLRQLYGAPASCVSHQHGSCERARKPAELLRLEQLAARVPAAAAADDGWPGVARRAPQRWNALQAILWLDAQGWPYDAAAMTRGLVNGSGDLPPAEQGGSNPQRPRFRL